MKDTENPVERLRSLVGREGWDYCILWSLADDQRTIEWIGCCCGGAESALEGGGGVEEHYFNVSPAEVPCKDVMFQHTRTRACDDLSQVPTSLNLDSGIHAQTLLSNQPRWIILPNLDSSIADETTATKVIVPIHGGLVELFVLKHVPEDHRTIDFIMSNFNHHLPHDFAADFHPLFPLSTSAAADNPHLQWDLFGGDLSRPMDTTTPFSEVPPQPPFMEPSVPPSMAESTVSREMMFQGGGDHEKESVLKRESAAARGAAGDSGSECSDQMDEEEEQKASGRPGKRHHSKNLVAERKRRKKLNDRLYTLRSLVPKITKMDRASILGDAIEFIKELQKQVKDLQDELERNPDEDNNDCYNNNNENNGDHINQGSIAADYHDQDKEAVVHTGPGPNQMERSRGSSSPDDKTQQMEVQVEVSQVDLNKFFLKVFSEHRPGGFTTLLEAMTSLGLEVTNVNVTTFRGLVSNVFKVEKRDNEVVQADQVRDSLFELIRNPNGVWLEPVKAVVEDGGGGGEHHHHNLHEFNTQHHHHHHHHQQHYLHQHHQP
ncbi:Transcription factor ABORTED MICROSPORES [Acorus gramineus]|uniref:Transcription factor ABORTED MICROSPORES n=1 Tax=Acorus gramineus TaxID=55184 RepID=A0AAV9ABD5_ACOGR|nr:Transcription factor ABORTED MICROSPORES [Acorus gramineus]